MQPKIMFSKVYTRDFPIVLCQVWGNRYESILGEKISVYPGYIYVFEKSLVRAYRNPSLVREVAVLFKRRVESDPQFLTNVSKENLGQVRDLKSYNLQEMDRQKLLNFLNKLHDFWEGMFVSMYIPEDERFSKEDRNVAFALREKIGSFEYDLFAIIDAALANIFPQLGNLARFLTKEEIESDEIPLVSVLQDRKDRTMYVVGGELLDRAAVDDLQLKYHFSLEQEEVLQKTNEFSGTVACRGTTRGTVRILLHNSDMSKVQRGDILVSSMTIPSFLPAMEEAAAFVTDEGGITCHAAIVARELGKPCIIGTKVATRVLKDGDMVEVDAEKGIVRILK